MSHSWKLESNDCQISSSVSPLFTPAARWGGERCYAHTYEYTSNLLCFSDKVSERADLRRPSSCSTEPDIWKGLWGGFVCDSFKLQWQRGKRGKGRLEVKEGRRKKMAPAYLNVTSTRWMCALLRIMWAFLTIKKDFLPSLFFCLSCSVGIISGRI